MYKPKLILIAGHNRAGLLSYPHLRDPGAVLRDSKGKEVGNEHHEAEKLVESAYVILKEQGYNVFKCGYRKNLRGKIKYCNKFLDKRDFVIEVHLNASVNKDANGFELYHITNPHRSLSRAEKMYKICCETLTMKGRGFYADSHCMWKRMAIVSDVRACSFLFEMGFLSNEEDLKKVRKYGVQSLVDCAKVLIRK